MKLLCFHIFLKFNHLTTYQYMLKKREQKENKSIQSKVISKITNE